MKFVIDDKIPYIRGAFEPFGEVIYLPGSKTTPAIVKNATVLVTRTRTICNEHLLKDSQVKFIASATIGYDHIDTEFCARAGIHWTNAPGCNSKSVEQYIVSALFCLAEKHRFELKGKSIGIVGVGNVGSKVAKVCEVLGMEVLLNDPPREREEGPDHFVSLEEIMERAEVITLHVPLNRTGIDKTYHLADKAFFRHLKKHPILINSARGEVVDNQAALMALRHGWISGLVLDCWENEPNINLELLDHSDIATPHIAGYSKDGKANGTRMSVQAVSRFFQLGINDWQPQNVETPFNATVEINASNLADEEIIKQAILATYDIRRDDERLRKNPDQFEKQRGNYPVRREYPTFTVYPQNVERRMIEKLLRLGFNVDQN